MRQNTKTIRFLAGLLAALLGAAAVPIPTLAAQEEQRVLQYQDLVGNDYHGRVNYFYDQDARCVREEWEETDEVVEYTYRSGTTLKTKARYRDDVLVERTNYDKWGNPTSILAYSDKGTVLTDTKITNTYDKEDRLTKASRKTEIDGVLHCVEETWIYEGAGNDGEKSEIENFGAPESTVRFHSVTEYTIDQGVRAIQKKERHTYDVWGNMTQHYVEVTSGYTRRYDYNHSCIAGELFYTEYTCTDFDEETETTGEIVYGYDRQGRLYEVLHTYPGGDGHTEYSWEYDDQGNVVKYSDQYRDYETNHYGPLSQVLWENED